jgi:serine/threonine protein kinase
MEYLDGESLARVLERGARVPFPSARSIAAQIADAIATAHEAGVVHWDLKPANVFLLGTPGHVTDLPCVKILEFGVARIKHGDPFTAVRCGYLGTPGYMAPEQCVSPDAFHGAENTKRTLEALRDPRLDVYALGDILYELFVGTRPRAWYSDIRTRSPSINARRRRTDARTSRSCAAGALTTTSFEAVTGTSVAASGASCGAFATTARPQRRWAALRGPARSYERRGDRAGAPPTQAADRWQRRWRRRGRGERAGDRGMLHGRTPPPSPDARPLLSLFARDPPRRSGAAS